MYHNHLWTYHVLTTDVLSSLKIVSLVLLTKYFASFCRFKDKQKIFLISLGNSKCPYPIDTCIYVSHLPFPSAGFSFTQNLSEFLLFLTHIYTHNIYLRTFRCTMNHYLSDWSAHRSAFWWWISHRRSWVLKVLETKNLMFGLQFYHLQVEWASQFLLFLFPAKKRENYNSTYFLRLLWGLNELIHMNYSSMALGQSMPSNTMMIRY